MYGLGYGNQGGKSTERNGKVGVGVKELGNWSQFVIRTKKLRRGYFRKDSLNL
jgi:hypothetical protein